MTELFRMLCNKAFRDLSETLQWAGSVDRMTYKECIQTFVVGTVA